MSRARDLASRTGSIIQTNTIRTDVTGTWTVPTSGSGAKISYLDISITPKYANSKILITWNITYEANYNNQFVIWKDGSLLSNGYNTTVGNYMWSGVAPMAYDSDVASTANTVAISFVDTPNTTSSVTYSVALRGTEGGTFALNRTFANVPQTNYESGISTATIQEIVV